ncbi:MAG: hypothetical protein NTU43_04705 [Bacteroidetes bacterium]|nr:hypothetical protein [Bacteroidota bacterium]
MPDYDCYENYGFKYTTIKGNGSFELVHALKTELTIGIPFYTQEYNRIVLFKFSNMNMILNDYSIGKKEYIYYLNTVTMLNSYDGN